MLLGVENTMDERRWWWTVTNMGDVFLRSALLRHYWLHCLFIYAAHKFDKYCEHDLEGLSWCRCKSQSSLHPSSLTGAHAHCEHCVTWNTWRLWALCHIKYTSTLSTVWVIREDNWSNLSLTFWLSGSFLVVHIGAHLWSTILRSKRFTENIICKLWKSKRWPFSKSCYSELKCVLLWVFTPVLL